MKVFDVAAVAFDVDGTLIDATAAIRHHWTNWAGRYGLDPDQVYTMSHGKRAQEIINLVAPLDQATALRDWEAMIQRQAEMTEGIVVIAGALEILRLLDATKAPWAMVTSAPRVIAEVRPRLLGIPAPPALVAAEDVANGKPHPEPFLTAASSLGVRPSDCLVVGDAPPDIEAARAAGMPCIAVAFTYPSDQLRGADLCIDKLEDLRLKVLGNGRIQIDG
jgi:sugar-phosphatase